MLSISHEKFTLSNGLDVILHEDHSIPIAAVNVWYHVGSKDEEVGRTGFAHLFEHVMFEGSKHHNRSYFDPLQKVGAGLNGSTTNDRTNYWETVPSNYLELALWLEADRMGFLLDALDQKRFDIQRDVVKNERRQSYENRPYGMAPMLLQPALFPPPHPYNWMTIGVPEDLDAATLDDVKSFFRRFYHPSNASLAIAGDFDPDEAVALAERYFGRLDRGSRTPEDPRTREMPQLAESRMVAYADTNPQVAIRYHTVRDGHVDEPALVVLGQLLNGRTGRLYKALVEEQEVATQASGGQAGFSFEGMFELRGTARQGRTPEEVEQAIYAELERLKTEPVGDRELQKVKNQNAAGNFRGLQGNFQLMMQLLIREGNRGWEHINTDPALYDAVTADDVMRVAQKYFTPESRAVAVYYREGGEDAEPDPLLAGLSDEERQQVEQVRAMIGQMGEEQLRGFLAQADQMRAQLPPESQDMADVLQELIERRLAELGGDR